MKNLKSFFAAVCAAVTVGRNCSFDLVRHLGLALDADYAAGDKVTFKLETLPKGLKLSTVQHLHPPA